MANSNLAQHRQCRRLPYQGTTQEVMGRQLCAAIFALDQLVPLLPVHSPAMAAALSRKSSPSRM